MALGHLLYHKAGRIHVPVYLANSIDFPTAKRDVEHGVEVYRYPVSDRVSLVVPRAAVERGIVGEVVEALSKFARMMAGNVVKQDPSLFDKTVAKEVAEYANLPEGAKDALWDTCKTLSKLIKANEDTIYGFIVKNVYRPATIGRFDVVIGNPPWLSYRFVRLPDYQRKLKAMILREHRLLSPKKSELLTQMELATLFFVRCALTYLPDGGTIGFVMPRAVFTGDQHDAFRRGDFLPRLGFVQIADLEAVSPLFNVPAAVIVAKKGRDPDTPSEALVVKGKLPEKNARMKVIQELQALHEFDISRVGLVLERIGERSMWRYAGESPCGGRPLRSGPSAYAEVFRNGAALYPRQFWWVELMPHPKLGSDPHFPYLRSSARSEAMAKDAYRGLSISGQCEPEFIYSSLLGADLLPFAHLPPRLIVAPAEPTSSGHAISTRRKLEDRGYRGIVRWMERVEKEWKQRRKGKAAKVDIYSYLDWGGKLSRQKPRQRFLVTYNTSGTFIAACLVDREALGTWTVDGQTMKLRGFLADITAVYYECQSREEGYYLAAILNSSVVDSLIKPMQARGLWGARHIHQKPFELGIPRFESSSRTYKELVTLAESCETHARRVMEDFIQAKGGKVEVLSPQVIGQLRSKIRAELAEKLDRIDALVCEILAT